MIHSEPPDALMSRVRDQALRRRVPIIGQVEVTYACNFGCRHCYLDPFRNNAQYAPEFLPKETWLRILDELTEAGTMWLVFSGGDPFTRADFLDIYEHACGNGLLCKIYTNGALLNEAVLDRLTACPPTRIEITLYGMSDQTYEQVTRVPGAYRRVMRVIEQLLARGLGLTLKATVTRASFPDVPRMLEFCRQREIVFKTDSLIAPRLDRSDDNIEHRLPPEQMFQTELDPAYNGEAILAHKMILDRESVGDPFDPDSRRGIGRDRRHLYFCEGGLIGYDIDPRGGVGFCPMDTLRVSCVDQPFVQVWNGPIKSRRLRPAPPAYRCRNCTYAQTCVACPVRNLLRGLDEPDIDPWFCQLSKMRSDYLEEHPACEAVAAAGDRQGTVREIRKDPACNAYFPEYEQYSGVSAVSTNEKWSEL
jgi:MoaA/NifB/PqqE/SkfB family radical SAM enzyme